LFLAPGSPLPYKSAGALERRACRGGAPAGPSCPRRNDLLDEAGHRPMLRGGRSVGMSGRLPGCQQLLADHGWHLAAGRVPPPGVVVLDPGPHPGPHASRTKNQIRQ
jgi:hypothetical protein